jgi:glycosyltransferase involved in cell wall biosynthesis
MSSGTVSILLPVWNGERFVSETIQSILCQDYRDIELIILDNQSTDSTPDICKGYASVDVRVKYFLDDTSRDIISAHARLAELATGAYCMAACDDDTYDPCYISTLVGILSSDDSIGLAYSHKGDVDTKGRRTVSKKRPTFMPGGSRVSNFARYLFLRTPVPMALGVSRMSLHKAALAYHQRPDHRGWNHDNLYMLRILSLAGIGCVTESLFFYRCQDRFALYRKRGQLGATERPLRHLVDSVIHQVAFSRIVNRMISEASFSQCMKHSLRIYNVLVLTYYCLYLGPKSAGKSILRGLRRLEVAPVDNQQNR